MSMLVRIAGIISVAILAGCSSSGPALTPVSGTVTLDNKALEGAMVRFLPQGDAQGQGGAGKTDASGKYEITAQRLNRKGVQPGEYKVIISRLVAPDGTLLPADAKPIETAAKQSVPEPYTRQNLTPLKVTVGAEAVTFDIPLKKN
jgi:hypothetical protein